jgi:hypothetical protein
MFLLACGGDDGGGGDTVDPNGTDTQYVADSVQVPASGGQASSLGLDLDGDGISDNALGQNLSILVMQGIDLQGAINEAVDAGTIIVLANLKATALDNATGVGISFYLGANPNPEPCTDPEDITTCGQHLSGDASFDLAANSPSDALIVGQLINGAFETTASGDVTLELDLLGETLVLNLIAARTAFNASANGLASGRLGGAITEDEARNNILPVLVTLVTGLVAADCMGTEDPCCTGGSTGAVLYDVFDTDDDCAVSDAEVENNDLVNTILSPDLDLLDASGNLNPNSDEVNDSISLGLGFSAVGAVFTP